MANNTEASKTRKTTTGKAGKDDKTMLRELFVDELKDIYWAEKHITKALPKMAKAATSQELANAFNEHLTVTEGQIGRLEQAFELMGMAAKGKKCEAMDGLVREGQQVMEETEKGTATRDAALIISAQKIEHYEIAAYGSLAQLAKVMGLNEVANLLGQTLEEEKQTDSKLTQIAESGININADNEPESGNQK